MIHRSDIDETLLADRAHSDRRCNMTSPVESCARVLQGVAVKGDLRSYTHATSVGKIAHARSTPKRIHSPLRIEPFSRYSRLEESHCRSVLRNFSHIYFPLSSVVVHPAVPLFWELVLIATLVYDTRVTVDNRAHF